MEKPTSEKDPAAVALGKKRQASMTPDERRAHQSAAGKAAAAVMSRRSFAERRMIALKGARTRRLQPRWLRQSNQRSAVSIQPAPTPPGSPGEPPTAELAALLESASDEAIARLAAALREHGAQTRT